ncbi:hypothetical protein RB653_008144 [Dictyostelium firmibasis]|uniref:Intimal thickness related receptor IRP domain-containing protein n=1 Tax=Dictyostelium firmibasis TaxID=79012 RepID=A0AAN7TZ98_9MYCE
MNIRNSLILIISTVLVVMSSLSICSNASSPNCVGAPSGQVYLFTSWDFQGDRYVYNITQGVTTLPDSFKLNVQSFASGSDVCFATCNPLETYQITAGQSHRNYGALENFGKRMELILPGSGGILPGESYLLGWGFISTLSSALIIWRTIYNVFFNRKKVKKAREAIHIVMSCFMILVATSFFITSQLIDNDGPPLSLIKGLVGIFILLNFFIPLLIFSILSLFLNYWIGISTDVRMNGRIFNRKTLALYVGFTSPLGIIALLNIIALNRVFDFKVTESIYLLAFYVPNALSLLLSIILITSIIILLNNTRKIESTHKMKTIRLLLKYLLVSVTIGLFSLLNIIDKAKYHFILPYEFHLVFLVIICNLIAFVINNDTKYLDPILDLIDKHIIKLNRSNSSSTSGSGEINSSVSLGSIKSSQKTHSKKTHLSSSLDNNANSLNEIVIEIPLSPSIPSNSGNLGNSSSNININNSLNNIKNGANIDQEK